VAREARSRGVQGVVCGHIHHAEMRMIDGMLYCNDGDWVESLTALVEHADGRLEIIDWRAAVALARVCAGNGCAPAPPAGTPPGLDVDVFDAHCEHLLVRTVETADQAAQVVGTYRVLTPAAARRVGGLYSDGEFDLVRLARLRPQLAELGRSCTAPEWRRGGVMLMLWSQLGSFMHRNAIERVVGCASVPMHDGGHLAADLWHTLRHTHLATADEQVRPRLPLPVHQLGTGRTAEPPALIKGYLKCGGKVLGPPAWDPDFGTADLPMMLRLSDMPAPHRRRFIGT
jgi:putative hemolysin